MITVAIGLLTYNRPQMLQRTLSTLYQAGYPFILELVDGGSSDGISRQMVRDLGGFVIEEGSTVGKAMNVIIERCLIHEPDLIVFSADDYAYRPGWLARLVDYWSGVPEDVALISCHMEPVYSWNEPVGFVDVNGWRGLVRGTLPGSSWTFKPDLWPVIGPIRDRTGGEDMTVCRKLLSMGKRLVAVDLAEHIGEQESAWGNQSWKAAQPLDRGRWGLPELRTDDQVAEMWMVNATSAPVWIVE